MKIGELERAVRAAIQARPGRPAMALIAGDITVLDDVPPEFAVAARTLSGRSQRSSARKSILQRTTASWM